MAKIYDLVCRHKTTTPIPGTKIFLLIPTLITFVIFFGKQSFVPVVYYK